MQWTNFKLTNCTEKRNPKNANAGNVVYQRLDQKSTNRLKSQQSSSHMLFYSQWQTLPNLILLRHRKYNTCLLVSLLFSCCFIFQVFARNTTLPKKSGLTDTKAPFPTARAWNHKLHHTNNNTQIQTRCNSSHSGKNTYYSVESVRVSRFCFLFFTIGILDIFCFLIKQL